MNGQVIPLQNSVTHLGHDIGNAECKKAVIDKGISNLITRCNFDLYKFSSCDSNVRNFLFQTYCIVTMALHFGACLKTILKDFIVTGENVFDVFGMFFFTFV